MKQIIAILLILAAIWGARELQSYWETVKARKIAQEGGAPVTKPDATATTTLPGLPPSLEASLQEAQKRGAAGLKAWLKSYRVYVKDPRLASIELDYVVLIGAANVKEARETFAAVKERTPTNSPVYARVKQLEKTYR
ncbi:MAG TPA: hypothetical protein VLU94_02960 [Candidatus Nitrosotalea sp.]|nr:hypothetical protein [Candidatus Nitrosotalea sp.]